MATKHELKTLIDSAHARLLKVINSRRSTEEQRFLGDIEKRCSQLRKVAEARLRSAGFVVGKNDRRINVITHNDSPSYVIAFDGRTDKTIRKLVQDQKAASDRATKARSALLKRINAIRREVLFAHKLTEAHIAPIRRLMEEADAADIEA